MKDQLIGKMFWAEMPLEPKELCRIEESHRIRPYLLFAAASDTSYYAFASTSKKPNNLSIESDYVLCGESKINLNEIFIITLDNILDHNDEDENGLIPFVTLTLKRQEELIKKLSINFYYNEYPEAVKRRIDMGASRIKYSSRDILRNKSNGEYVVCSNYDKCGFILYNITFVPTEGYIEFMSDGYRCFIDMKNPFIEQDLSDYELYSVCSNVQQTISSKRNNDDIAKSTVDVSSIGKLPIGSVISMIYEEDTYVLIKTNEDEDCVTFLLGRAGSYQRDYVEYTVYKDEDFEYEFLHILCKEKYEYVLSKHTKKENR